MGRRPIGDRAMTATERVRRFRALHEARLPWAEDMPFNPELAAWEAEALEVPATKQEAVVVPCLLDAPDETWPIFELIATS